MDGKKIFEYSQFLRSRYLDTLAGLPWEEVIRNRGASFDSMRNILLHTIDNEDRLVNYVLQGRLKDWAKRNPEDFEDVASVRGRVQEVETKAKAYVAELTSFDLDRMVEYPRMGKPPTSVRIEDILIGLTMENINHLGELITLLWQIDVEPPHMGWTGYLQESK
jgi:uncharacterized damage-inducible protein DinB